MMKLRDYQRDIFEQLITSLSNDLVQLDTGAGKTPIEAALAEWAPRIILVAHRNILITQISEKLAAFGITHDTISTEHTRRRCIAAHKAHGRSFIERGHSTHLVASMPSIAAAVRHHRLTIDREVHWLIVIDEAHHITPGNMWGQLLTLFPQSRIVGFTATPARMDGESLHVDNGGVFHRLVQAESLQQNSVRTLIEWGYLSGFIAYKPIYEESPHDRRMREDPEYAAMMDDFYGVPPRPRSQQEEGRRERVVGLEWNTGVLHLYGDPVAEYQHRAMGKPAILMAPAIKNAEEFAQQFREAGIPAACINSMQTPGEIARLLDAFRDGRVKVLTNVDMVGEGFDLPACKCLIIATRTASFPRYRQWCGRVLRPDPSGDPAIIIDLTGMCIDHGLPDEPVKWDLLRPPCGPLTKRQVPCSECGGYFEFKLEYCPHCGAYNRWLDESSCFAPGSYYFTIQSVDRAGVEMVRRERRQAEATKLLQTELLKTEHFGHDAVGYALTKIAAWFPQQLQAAGVEIYDINRFIQSQEARSRDFWMTQFTLNDTRSDNQKKALRAYQKWQKQHSSAAMQRTTASRLT